MDFDRVRLGAGVLVATAAGVWGQLGMLIQLLLILMALDLVSGILAAYYTQSLSSAHGWRGIARKSLTLGVVTMAHLAGPFVGGLPMGEAVAGFYAAIEALSILENAGRAGVPIPNFLRDAMVKLKEQTSGPDRPRRVGDGGAS